MPSISWLPHHGYFVEVWENQSSHSFIIETYNFSEPQGSKEASKDFWQKVQNPGCSKWQGLLRSWEDFPVSCENFWLFFFLLKLFVRI